VRVAIAAILAGMLLPALAEAKAKSTRLVAVNNLKQIGLAARIYAGDHDGKLPSSLEQMKEELSTDKVAIDHQTVERFVFLGARRGEAGGNSILAYSPARQGGGRDVLLADGSVKQMREEQFASALQSTGGGL